MSTVSEERYHPGLEDVIASETAIASIEGREGAGGLEYRGYAIEDLAGAVSYEEAAFLLLHGDLPTASQLDEFNARLRSSRAIPGPLVELYRRIPRAAHRMDVLRTSVSILSHFDPEVNASPSDHAANVRKAERLIAQMPTAIAFRERIVKGLEPVVPRNDLDHAANFLNMVNGQVPSEAMRRAFDLSLVLYTEHELNASTFAARVTVSTALGHPFRDRRGDRDAQGPAPRRGQRGGLEGPRGGRLPRERGAMDPRRPGPQAADHGLRPPRLQDRRPAGPGPPGALLPAGRRDRQRALGTHRRDDRAGRRGGERPAAERRLAQRPALPLYEPGHRPLHADLRDGPGRRLVGAHHRAARPQPPDEAPRPLRRAAPRHVKPIDQR